MKLEELVEKAAQGDRRAVEELIRQIQDRIYNLAVRMLWHPADAEDATQEILTRIVTHLSTFRGESSFGTWAYRIATNYLLTTRKRRLETPEMTLENFSHDLDAGLLGTPATAFPDAEMQLLAEEVKIGCTQAMLLCLDRRHRLAYILGDILELNSREAGEILDIPSQAFRKRLSRARKTIGQFMNRKCGIVNPRNPCRCARRIRYAIDQGRVDPGELLFADHPVRASKKETLHQIARLNAMQRAAAVYRSQPEYAAPNIFVENIRRLVRVRSSATKRH